MDWAVRIVAATSMPSAVTTSPARTTPRQCRRSSWPGAMTGCCAAAARARHPSEWRRIEQERQVILDWGRRTKKLQEVVQEYRFSRRQGDASYKAHENASRIV